MKQEDIFDKYKSCFEGLGKLKDLATVSEPLRGLKRKDVHFSWGKEQEAAFNELKKRLAKTETLGYFDSAAKNSHHN